MIVLMTILYLENNNDLYNELIKSSKIMVRCAVKGLLKAKGQYILFQDADLEYDPNDYVKLIEPILRFNADVVMGSNFPQFTRVYYFWHKIGNRLIVNF